MIKAFFCVLIAVAAICMFDHNEVTMQIQKSMTIDSLGACQGASYQNGKIFLYGDREVGMIREYQLVNDSLVYQNKEIRLTVKNTDVINHPTGLAVHDKLPVFIGNSIRLNPEGTLWKAVIYHVDWEQMQKTGSLDGNLLNTVDDDACIQGTRPEYVEYKGKWYVATADYGDHGNEVRLYDPVALAKAKRTSEKNVLFKKFTCTPWVQNLCWIPGKNMLLLIQNQVEGRRWRFTYIDLAKSIELGSQKVIKVVDVDRGDELEGFAFLQNLKKGIAVSSSRKNNVNLMDILWK